MTWWLYLLLVNLYLGLFFGFYMALLRRETFFQLNRVYLVVSAILSFLIPVIQAEWVRNLFITQQVQHTIYGGSSPIMYRFQVNGPQHVTVGDILTFVYIAGAALLSAKLLWQLFTLSRVINNETEGSAFSFFKKIRLGADPGDDHNIIEAHEQAHAGQWHSVDVLLIELIAIINWFNPAVYFYKKAIRNIHEFIADEQALKSGTNKSEYALLLVSQAFQAPAHHLVNPFFNDSTIKQRIMMLQKDRSKYAALIKYGLSAPLFILMLILSSATVNKSNTISVINSHAARLFDSPANLSPGDWDNSQQSDPRVNNQPAGLIIDNPQPAGKSARSKKQDAGKVDLVLDEAPSFKGGYEKFYQYLAKNLRYPASLREAGVQGRVIATFVVETDGSLSGIKILRDIGPGAGDEVVRVLKQSPNWLPGLKNGKMVRSSFTIPVSFTIQPGGTDTIPAKNQPDPGMIRGRVTNLTVTVDSTQNPNNKVVLSDGKTPVVFLVDGVRVENINSIDPKNIESVTVYKGKQYVDIYGPMALNGIVSIKMKPKTN